MRKSLSQNDGPMTLAEIRLRNMDELTRLKEEGYGAYRIDLVEKLSPSWRDFLKTWGMAFLVAAIILIAIRQATLYILAGRS